MKNLKIINFDLKEGYDFKRTTTIALGKFETFHKGHQKIFKKALKISKLNKNELIIMLYPDWDGFENKSIKNFLTLEKRIKILSNKNIKFFLIFEPNIKNYSVSVDDFLSYLKNNLNVKNLIVGKNFSFSKNTDSEDFRKMKKLFNFFQIKEKKHKFKKISSSWIKLLLYEKNFKKIKKLVGYRYFIEATYNEKNNNFNFDFKNKLIPYEGFYEVYIEECSKKTKLTIELKNNFIKIINNKNNNFLKNKKYIFYFK